MYTLCAEVKKRSFLQIPEVLRVTRACVFVWDSEWKSRGRRRGKKRSAWQVCLSWLEPKRLPAAAFKVSLCVLWSRITKPLTHIQWSSVCNVLSAGLLHVHIGFACMHQHKGSSWVRTSCVTTPGVRDPPRRWSLLSLASTRPQLSLCPSILSDPCLATVGRTAPRLPRHAWRALSVSPEMTHVKTLQAVLLLTFTLLLHTFCHFELQKCSQF